jgi:zinc transporter ZupT
MTDWLPPLVAVTVISLSGFLAILLFPCMLTSSSSDSNSSSRSAPNVLSQSALLKFLVALCIGTLLGDAVIHLIPDIFTSEYVIGPLAAPPNNSTINSTAITNMRNQIAQCIMQCSPSTECQADCWQGLSDAEETRSSTGTREPKQMEILEMAAAILLGLYFFYTVERLIQHKHGHHDHSINNSGTAGSCNNTDDTLQGSNEGGRNYAFKLIINCSRIILIPTDFVDSSSTLEDPLASRNSNDLEVGSCAETVGLLARSTPRTPIQSPPVRSLTASSAKSKLAQLTESVSDIRSFGWVVLMGEALHNIVDGLAIGAAFASSFQIGLGTALSILLHEIPHELGDFAIYINAGFTPIRALLINCFVNLTSFIGVIVSLSLVGSANSTSDPDDPDTGRSRLWVLAFTAGNFIYIALVDLIPELTRDDSAEHHDSGSRKRGWWKASKLTLLEHSGMLCGVGCMVLIKLYGEADGGE